MPDSAQADVIRASGLFDPEFYRQTYGHWLAEGVDPLRHFLETGLARGYLPSPDFDPVLYRILVRECGEANPLTHHLRSGVPFQPQPLPALFPQVRAQISLRGNADGADQDVERNRAYAREAATAKDIVFVAAQRVYTLTVPAPETFLDRLRYDQPFAFARLTHGFWDALWMLARADDALAAHELTGALPPLQRRALATRVCAALRPRTGTFAPSFIDELLADIPLHAAHPDFLRSVSFKGYPTFDEDVFGNRAIPPPGAVSLAFAASFRPDEKIYDATAWKRLLIAGRLEELPSLCRDRPVVLVASDLFSDLDTRWRLDDFTHVEIPRSLAQWQRRSLLARTSDAVAAACARGARPPAVLLECGSLAAWLTTRLFTTHPRVFYLDLGQALNGWFFDVVEPAGSAWASTYACSVIENCRLESCYRARLGPRYDEWIAALSRPDLARERTAQRKGAGAKLPDGTRREVLGAADLVEAIKARNPGLFDAEVTEETASVLLAQAFEVIRERLGDTSEGEMQIRELGAFQVRQVERGEGDARVMRKVVNLRLK